MTEFNCTYTNCATIRLNAARTLPVSKTTTDATSTNKHQESGTSIHGHTFVASVNFGPNKEIDNTFNYPEQIDAITNLRSQLDNRLLNEVIDYPSDSNIVSYIYDALGSLNIQSARLTSAFDRGVHREVDTINAWQTFQFESAHQLPFVPEGHKCGRMHGHSFYANLFARITPEAEWQDLQLLENYWQPLHQKLNYQCLNRIDGLENPTSENLATWIWHQLNSCGTTMSHVEVLETPTAGCSYSGNKHTSWKDFSIDCALNTRGQADTLFGHTYHVRVYIESELDPIFGWTMDFADIKDVFEQIADQVDHHNITEALGLADNAALSRYLVEKLLSSGIPLSRLDVHHNPGQGIVAEVVNSKR